MNQTTLRLPHELLDRIDREAEADQRTRSAVVRVAVSEYLDRAEARRHGTQQRGRMKAEAVA